MNAAKLSSKRLKRFLEVLYDGKEHITRDIIRKANVCAVNSIAAELRTHKIEIICKKRGKRFYYRLGRYISGDC